jgi:hypothetical protein
MKRHLIVLLSVAVVSVAGPLMFTGSLSAHHGRQGTYDAAKEVTLSGAVTEFVWRNPHVVIYLDVKDADGELVNCGLETSSVSTMSRQGWSRNTLRPGRPIRSQRMTHTAPEQGSHQ